MNTNDLVTYTSAMSTTTTSFIVAMGLVLAGILTALGIMIYGRSPRRTRIALVATGVTASVLLVGTMITMKVVANDLGEKERVAHAANAETLKAWAEPGYGITINDEAAVRVMNDWGVNHADWAADTELTFEAETVDGTVQLELKEDADGSFRLIQTGTELKAVDGQ